MADREVNMDLEEMPEIPEELEALLLYALNECKDHILNDATDEVAPVDGEDDETREIAREIVRCDALDKVLIGLDYFDASINRVAAWVIGCRNMQKALLGALLEPHARLAELQNAGNFTEMLMLQEELRTLPFGDIWEHYCEMQGVPADESWFETVRTYEKDVLSLRK